MIVKFAKRSGGDAPDPPSEKLVALVHAERGHLSARQRAEGAQSLVARWTWNQHGRWRRRESRAVWAVGFSVAVVVAVAVAVQWRGVGTLSYAIEGGRIDRAGVITSLTAEPPRLRFSDGTEVRFAPGAKAAIRSVDGRGARVSLAEGSAQVDVTHVPGARWLFDAGPFLITVTGTAFTVEWRGEDEQLDVRMKRGSVQVSGPLSDQAVVLGSGEHLTVRMRQRETLIRSLDDASATSAPPPVAGRDSVGVASAPRVVAAPGPSQPAAGPARVTRQAAGASPSTSASVEAMDWQAELADGEFETIVRQAQQVGLESCLGEVRAADLAVLADAARYGRYDDIARRALLAQRRRFPLSPAATDAAFLLGRLEEAEQHAVDAIEWYGRYLADAAMGTYASEALGRKMTLTQRLYGEDQARDLAREYIGRFPQGTYATRARSLARMP